MTQTIWALGRNYVNHAKEMGAEIPKEPLVFIKAGGCAVVTNKINLPTFSNDIHHEIEIAVKLGADLKPESIALAIDLTARDIQITLKKKGHPWALAKSFKDSCPTSQWIPFETKEWFTKLDFQLSVNGEIRQKGQTKDMLFNLDQTISFLMERYPLQPGDIILTGTPEGVGPIKSGDQINSRLMDLIDWDLKVL